MNATKQILEQLIFISIDSYENKTTVGRLWHGYERKEIHFDNLMQLFLNVDKVLGDTGYPEESVKYKLFVNPDTEKTDTGASLTQVAEPSYGALATFKIKIIFRQNASWQGTITWLDSKQEQSFRSTLELTMLMDSALTYADRPNYIRAG